MQAAVQLHLAGLSDGDAILREYISNPPVSSEIWNVTETAFVLLDSGDLETRQAMRIHMQKALNFLEEQGEEATGFNYLTAPMSVYLLAYGDDEDRKLASRAVQSSAHAFYLGFLAEDPLVPAKHLVQADFYGDARKLWAGFRDRSPGEAWFLQETLKYMLVTHAANKQTGLLAERDTYLYDDITRFYTSCFQPSREIVRSFGGFAKTLVALDPNRGGITGTKLQYFTWLPKPEYLDAYIAKWFEGNFGYMDQLDYIETDAISEAVQKHGNGKTPPLYELFLALHRISTRAGTNRLDCYPMGIDRRAYLLIHKGEGNHGGLNGVAELKYGFKGETLQIRLRLDQKAYYHGGTLFGQRVDRWDSWPHNRYVGKGVRSLIKNIVLRSDEQSIIAEDTGRVEDGFFVFETKIPRTKSADWYIDVNMEFVNQKHTLTYSLISGENARRIRRSVDRAASVIMSDFNRRAKSNQN